MTTGAIRGSSGAGQITDVSGLEEVRPAREQGTSVSSSTPSRATNTPPVVLEQKLKGNDAVAYVKNAQRFGGDLISGPLAKAFVGIESLPENELAGEAALAARGGIITHIQLGLA